jgi:hypothetical protein
LSALLKAATSGPVSHKITRTPRHRPHPGQDRPGICRDYGQDPAAPSARRQARPGAAEAQGHRPAPRLASSTRPSSAMTGVNRQIPAGAGSGSWRGEAVTSSKDVCPHAAIVLCVNDNDTCCPSGALIGSRTVDCGGGLDAFAGRMARPSGHGATFPCARLQTVSKVKGELNSGVA